MYFVAAILVKKHSHICFAECFETVINPFDTLAVIAYRVAVACDYKYRQVVSGFFKAILAVALLHKLY